MWGWLGTYQIHRAGHQEVQARRFQAGAETAVHTAEISSFSRKAHLRPFNRLGQTYSDY